MPQTMTSEDEVAARVMQKLAREGVAGPELEKKQHIEAQRKRAAEARRRGAFSQPLAFDMPGLGPMTPVPTLMGQIPAQTVRERDKIRCGNGEIRTVVRVDRILLDEAFLSAHPEAMPVLVRKGSVGRGYPEEDLLMSPRQPIAPGTLGIDPSKEVAADLIGRPGVSRKAEAMFTYTVIYLDAPALVPISNVGISFGTAED